MQHGVEMRAGDSAVSGMFLDDSVGRKFGLHLTILRQDKLGCEHFSAADDNSLYQRTQQVYTLEDVCG
jgi:hypothetical protein